MAYKNFSQAGKDIIDPLIENGFEVDYKPVPEYLPAAEFRGQLDVEDQVVPSLVCLNENVNTKSPSHGELSLYSGLYLDMNPIEGDVVFDIVRNKYKKYQETDESVPATDEQRRELHSMWKAHCRERGSKWCGGYYDEKTDTKYVAYNHAVLGFRKWFNLKAMNMAREIGKKTGVPITELGYYPRDMNSISEIMLGDMPVRVFLPSEFYKEFPGVSTKGESSLELLDRTKLLAQHLINAGYSFANTDKRKREDWIEPEILRDLC